MQSKGFGVFWLPCFSRDVAVKPLNIAVSKMEGNKQFILKYQLFLLWIFIIPHQLDKGSVTNQAIRS